jgi:hypothetical protein
MSLIHDRVDVEKWIKAFPLSTGRAEARREVMKMKKENPANYPSDDAVEEHVQLMSPGGESINSAQNLAYVVQLRQECEKEFAKFKKVPTDVMVWNYGEPKRREVTKIGGVPYWPKSKPWPQNSAGEPLQFIGQICFADSRDLFPKLPEDVLLIFTNGLYCDDWYEAEESPDAVHYEWLPLKESNLIGESAVPKQSMKLLPCYGSVYRTFDYDGVDRKTLNALEKKVQCPWKLDVIAGTKIGGVAGRIQEAPKMTKPLLCSINSVEPATECPWPFLNSEKEIKGFRWKTSDKKFSCENALSWGDAGAMFLFLNKRSQIEGIVESY